MNSSDFNSHFIMNKTQCFHLKDGIYIFILTTAFGSVLNETVVNYYHN